MADWEGIEWEPGGKALTLPCDWDQSYGGSVWRKK